MRLNRVLLVDESLGRRLVLPFSSRHVVTLQNVSDFVQLDSDRTTSSHVHDFGSQLVELSLHAFSLPAVVIVLDGRRALSKLKIDWAPVGLARRRVPGGKRS